MGYNETKENQVNTREEMVATDKEIEEAYINWMINMIKAERAVAGTDNPVDQVMYYTGHPEYVKAEARYEGWSRFFGVAGGHIHSSMDCSTCNRWTYKSGQTQTAFVWLTELSGLTQDDAVAKYGATLCSRCFPEAPVENTKAKLSNDMETGVYKRIQANEQAEEEARQAEREAEEAQMDKLAIDAIQDMEAFDKVIVQLAVDELINKVQILNGDKAERFEAAGFPTLIHSCNNFGTPTVNKLLWRAERIREAEMGIAEMPWKANLKREAKRVGIEI
tara:strand:+ start:2206 stop:3036 length:831 start_codon:yes stop_codon:yes gene_type:complete